MIFEIQDLDQALELIAEMCTGFSFDFLQKKIEDRLRSIGRQRTMNQAVCAVFLIETTISGVRKEKFDRIRSVEEVAVFLHPLEATYTEEQKNQVEKRGRFSLMEWSEC